MLIFVALAGITTISLYPSPSSVLTPLWVLQVSPLPLQTRHLSSFALEFKIRSQPSFSHLPSTQMSYESTVHVVPSTTLSAQRFNRLTPLGLQFRTHFSCPGMYGTQLYRRPFSSVLLLYASHCSRRKSLEPSGQS